MDARSPEFYPFAWRSMKRIELIGGYIIGFTGLFLFIVAIGLGKAFSAIGAYINKQCERVVAAVCGF